MRNSADVHITLSTHLSTKTNTAKNLFKINDFYIQKEYYVVTKLLEVTQDQIQ